MKLVETHDARHVDPYYLPLTLPKLISLSYHT